MYIAKLRLVKCKRLMSKGISSIEIDFNRLIQIIMGTNGSGKTSIMMEANPSPIVEKQYLPGGGKYGEFHHKGSVYIVESKVEAKGSVKHFFKVDDEVLNDWGNSAVQAQLVKEHFGLDPKINALLIGKVRFTQLDKAKRREWITRICHVDFDYAFSIYERSKRSMQDSRGAMRHNLQRLAKEKQTLESLVWQPADAERSKQLAADLQAIMRETHPFTPSDQLKTQLDTTVEQFITQSRRLLRTLNRPVMDTPINTLGDLKSMVDAAQEKANVLSAHYQERLRDAQQLSAQVDTIRVAENNPATYRQLIAELSQQRAVILEKHQRFMAEFTSPFDLMPTPAINLLERTDEAMETFMVIMRVLPDTPEGRTVFDQIPVVEKAIKTLNAKLDHYEQQVYALGKRLAITESVQPVECPKCEHQFLPGFGPNEIPTLKAEIEKGEALITRITATRTDQQAQLEQLIAHRGQLRRLHELMQAFPDLQPFWDVVLTRNLMYEAPLSGTALVPLWRETVLLSFEYRRLEDQLAEQTTLLGVAEKAEAMNISQMKLQLTLQEEQLFHLKQDVERQREITRHLTEAYKCYRQYHEALQQQQDQYQTITTLTHDYLDATRQEALESVILGHQVELADLGQRQHRHSITQGIVDDLERDTASVRERHEAFKLLTRALGPDEGLIADTLSAFIHRVVEMMNQYLAAIWEYELKISPCKVDKGDLDFRFPYMAGFNEDIDDIREGSDSQLDMFDLCFRLVAMQYLGLTQYPLYLDEFTSSFDEQHRENGLRFVRQLIETGQYSQLLFISHYASVYTGFEDANICVTDPTNVVVPEIHNTNVLIA